MSDLGNNTYWSETDASNNAAVPNGWPEGMQPSGVNNSARADKGALKRFWNRSNSTKTTAGSLSAYTLTYDVAAASLYAGEEHSFVLHATCGANPTLNVNGLGAKNLRKFTAGAFTNLAAGDLAAGQPVRVRYNQADDKYDLLFQIMPAPFPTGVIADFIGANPPSGWVLAFGTIGNASSGATNRANADCEALFTLLWNDMADGQAPVSGGRGANAAADWAANKTIGGLDERGLVRAGKDDMGGTAANRLTAGVSGMAGSTLGAIGGDQRMQQHAHGVTDPSHTHGTNADNSGLGNVSSGNSLWQTGGGSGGTVTSAPATTGITIQNAGSGGAQNVQPTIVRNVIVKL